MKVFITGATGYIGRRLCRAFTARGWAVTGLTRSREKAAWLSAQGVEPVVGQVDDADVIYSMCRKAGAVVHAAIEGGEHAGLVDASSVRLMLEALAGSQKPFIYTSGVWVYGDTGGRLLDENGPLNPPPLVVWRPAVEHMVTGAAGSGVKSMVVRPGVVYGHGGGLVASMFAQARRDKRVRFPGDGRNHWSLVHAGDLAELYSLALESPRGGELFLATNGMPQTLENIALAVAAQCGAPGRIEAVPAGLARTAMGAVADCLMMDQRLGSDKAMRLLGWKAAAPAITAEISSGGY